MANVRHRKKRAPEYNLWITIYQRCYNPKSSGYYKYGKKGIRVCQRWRDSFPAFLADVGRRPSPDYSLDRFPDRHGNYEPGNVRWATRKEQQINRDVTHQYSYGGFIGTLEEWSKRTGISYTTLDTRIRRGWSLSQAFSIGKNSHVPLLTYNGFTGTIDEWASLLRIPYGTLAIRLRRGWSLKRALTPRLYIRKTLELT